MSDVVIRPLAAGELPLFNEYSVPSTTGVGARSRTFDEFVAAGDYRPAWTWVALRDSEVIARAAFWGPPDSPHPYSLDWFDCGSGPDRVQTGADLLRTAYAAIATPDYWAPPHPHGGRPDYHLFLPADWRERPAAFAEASDRIRAAELAGLTYHRERINFRWIPSEGAPPATRRLSFIAADDDQRLIDILAKICSDSLDADDQHEVASSGPEAGARAILSEVGEMPGGRDRWRLARDTAGDVVGLVLPTRNPSTATIGYIGVLPEHRGHGYASDLVAEAQRQFAAAGEPEVNDSTDAANAPMSATFARRGYRVTGRRVIMT
ncbi:GNAT family N-acetyltransferase [Phytoactinopolyspora alkaliphila]|uniref:GNAT family N-acetyltransferase n=1 Tax=Phytoactinopolyspora alkaliphila TaxID=1783498 RepID=A0A6N9YGW9_9ACTN|nr:GNAT family N-acetyltransferase [Phytoactinopolyspora alkaliphila]NED94243.1 GNAT family N-acetyltransferase [Phytoactinopolyspora alkaliphila]